MARHTLRTADGEGFLRAFTDAWIDTEETYHVSIVAAMHPTKRRGVLALILTAWVGAEAAGEWPKARYHVEYPTAAVATFEAALFQAMNKLDRILEQQEKWPEGRA